MRYFTAVLFFIFLNSLCYSQDVFEAARMGQISRLKVLLKINKDTLSSVNENGFCPLLLATYRNQSKTVKFLVKQKVNLNQGSQEGTPIVAAAFKGNIKIAKILLKEGADANVRGHDGATALIFATQNGDEKMILLLLKYKADPHIKDFSGKSAIEYAKASENDKIKAIFR